MDMDLEATVHYEQGGMCEHSRMTTYSTIELLSHIECSDVGQNTNDVAISLTDVNNFVKAHDVLIVKILIICLLALSIC